MDEDWKAKLIAKFSIDVSDVCLALLWRDKPIIRKIVQITNEERNILDELKAWSETFVVNLKDITPAQRYRLRNKPFEEIENAKLKILKFRLPWKGSYILAQKHVIYELT